MNTSDLAILIPARGGSKRIPNKNIALIGRKPLITYVISEALMVSNSVYVSTNDPSIAKIAEEAGASIIDRPDNLCLDTSKSSEAVEHFLSLVKTKYFLLVQPTSPLLTAQRIKSAASLLIEDEFDSVVSVCEKFSFNWSPNGEPINFDKAKRPRTQDAKHWYEENGAVYGTSSSRFLNTKMLWSGHIGFVKMTKAESVDIDDWDDMEMADALIRTRKLL